MCRIPADVLNESNRGFVKSLSSALAAARAKDECGQKTTFFPFSITEFQVMSRLRAFLRVYQ